MRALYAGEVTLVDRWVGRLLAKIEDLGLFDNTAIIFTTDHGFYHGEHNLTGKSIILEEKNYHGLAPLYEEVAHIPLIVRLPDAKKGWRCNAFVQPPDIMPTILDLVGAEDPGTMHGRSYLPVLKGEMSSIRDFTVTSSAIIYGPVAGQRITVTNGEWSLIYAGNQEEVKGSAFTSIVDGIRREQHPLGEVRSELYYIKEDPRETVNLIDERRDIAIEIHRRLLEFLKSIGTQEKYLKFWDKI
jgi:arylsulfatase A-like enzyme